MLIGINNPFQMVVLIVLISAIASVVRARYGVHRGWRRGRERFGPDASADTDALHAEIKALKDRVAVLERLATDDNAALMREFEALRREG